MDLTVLIPVYNQPHLLRRCLTSLRLQTFKGFEIIIIDDSSSVSYAEVISEFNDLIIDYRRNEVNLGAVPNMLYCLTVPVETEFKTVFHEDDIMYPDMLKEQLDFHKTYHVGWVGTNTDFFKGGKLIKTLENKLVGHYSTDLKEMVLHILNGRTLAFGSIVYRSSVVKRANFEMEKFSVMGDRPMLLELAREHGCGYLNYSLMAANDHGEDDNRWNSLKTKHIVQYHDYLATFFTREELKQKELKIGFTHGYLNGFKLLSPSQKYVRYRTFFNAYLKGLFSWKYFLLSFSSFRHFVYRLKSVSR